MNQIDICLNSTQDAVDFVKCVDQYSCSMDLCCGSCVVDAKSIMGVLGMAVGKKSRLCIYEDCVDEIVTGVKAFMA
ncbi:MAG: HPr family phosphocarrier protein [Lachnospiraceae bacterium]